MNYDKKYYEVIVGNIGKVHEGNSKAEALKIFNEYVKQSKNGYGRAAGEGVDLYDSGEDIIKSYAGTFNENPRPRANTPEIHIDVNSHNQREAGAYMKNPAPRAVTQDDINAAARGLRMLTMPQDELKQLVKETNPDNFAGAVIIAAAKQMIGAKRQVGMFKKNPARPRMKPFYDRERASKTNYFAVGIITPNGARHIWSKSIITKAEALRVGKSIRKMVPKAVKVFIVSSDN